MDYHLEITKKGNCRFFFFRGRGNNILIFFFYVLNFPKIRVRLKMILPFLSLWTNLLYDRLLRLQILFMWLLISDKLPKKKYEKINKRK